MVARHAGSRDSSPVRSTRELVLDPMSAIPFPFMRVAAAAGPSDKSKGG